MDIEKYTNSKLYFIFEWGFKLIMWNLLSLLIICLVAGTPFIFFFKIQDDHAIDNVAVLEDNTLEVTQHNGDITNIGNRFINDEVTKVTTGDNVIYLSMEKYIIQVNNPDNIKNIEGGRFNDNKLIITALLSDGSLKDYDFGSIYESNIDVESSKINSYQETVIVYENGVNVNYGRVLNTNGTLAGILVIIGLALAVFSFIPTYATIFSIE